MVSVQHFDARPPEFLVKLFVENPHQPFGVAFTDAVLDTGSPSSYLDENFADQELLLEPIREIQTTIEQPGSSGIIETKVSLKVVSVRFVILDARFTEIRRDSFEVCLLKAIDTRPNIKMIFGMDFLNYLDIAYFVRSSRNTLILSDDHPIADDVIRAALRRS